MQRNSGRQMENRVCGLDFLFQKRSIVLSAFPNQQVCDKETNQIPNGINDSCYLKSKFANTGVYRHTAISSPKEWGYKK